MSERNVVLLGLGIITAYDIITTITGTISILGASIGATIASILLGSIIGGFLYFSYEIQKIDSKSSDFLIDVLKIVWWLAFIYDLYTSFTGNNRFIIQTELTIDQIGKVIILAGLTLFVSSCPIILSYLRNNVVFMQHGLNKN